MTEALTLKDLELSARTHNVLLYLGARTIDDVCRFTPEKLLEEPNFGRKSLMEIQEVLAMHDRALGDLPDLTPAELVAQMDLSRFNAGQIARLWHEAHANIETMEKQLKESAPYATAKAILDEIDKIATKMLEDSGASSINTPFGTIHTVGKTTARIMDPDLFKGFLNTVPDPWPYVDLKANMTACRSRLDEEKAPVPGVELTTYRRLSITAPKAPMKRLDNVE